MDQHQRVRIGQQLRFPRQLDRAGAGRSGHGEALAP